MLHGLSPSGQIRIRVGGAERVRGNAFGQNQGLGFHSVSSTSLSAGVCILFHLLLFLLVSLSLLLLCPALPNHLLFSAFSLPFILALRFFLLTFPCVVLMSSSLCVYLVYLSPSLYLFGGWESLWGFCGAHTLDSRTSCVC